MTRLGQDAISTHPDDEREGRQHNNPFHGAVSLSVECILVSVYHAPGTGPSSPHRGHRLGSALCIENYGLKAFAFLRLAGLAFRHEHNFDASDAPRGQLPYLVDGAEVCSATGPAAATTSRGCRRSSPILRSWIGTSFPLVVRR